MNLHKEYPTMLCGKFPLRIYNKKSPLGADKTTVWYFGFPKRLIDPIKDLLGTSCFWDENFDKEDGEFYVISAGVVGNALLNTARKALIIGLQTFAFLSINIRLTSQ